MSFTLERGFADRFFWAAGRFDILGLLLHLAGVLGLPLFAVFFTFFTLRLGSNWGLEIGDLREGSLVESLEKVEIDKTVDGFGKFKFRV